MKARTEYNHAVAFNLMKYRCEDCHREETLWNSRDGVTPFVIDCRRCKGAMQHADWHKDQHDPSFGEQFKSGQFPTMRVFVTITKEKAREYAVKRLIRFEGSDSPPPKRTSTAWNKLVEDVAEDFYHNGEGPDAITGAEWASLPATRE